MDAFVTISVVKPKLPFSPSFSKNLLNIEKEKKRAGEVRLPDFRRYYKATLIKTVW